MRSFLQLYHDFGPDQLTFVADILANINVQRAKPYTAADGRCLSTDIEAYAIRTFVAFGMTNSQATFFANWVLGIKEFESEDSDGFVNLHFD
jgi:hypothetical protein